MDGLEFASKAIDSLVWPVTSVVIILVMRSKVLEIIPRLRKLEAGPLKAEFADQLAAVKEEAKVVEASIAAADVKLDPFRARLEANVGAAPPTFGAPEPGPADYMPPPLTSQETPPDEDGNEDSPIVRVIGEWAEVERAARRALRLNALDTRTPRPTELVAAHMPKDLVMVYQKLRNLRNKVAHGEVTSLTNGEAQDFSASAQILIRMFKHHEQSKRAPDSMQ